MRAGLRRAALGLSLALAWLPAPAGGMRPPVAIQLGGLDLVLEERDAKCFIRHAGPGGDGQARSLDMPAPCQFHRDDAGAVRSIRRAGHQYALVESARPAGPADGGCVTQLRAIRIAGKQLQISEHKDVVASCPPFQWDRLVFTALFD